MNQIEKKFIELPKSDIIKSSNESTYNKVYRKLIRKLVLNSIGKYYNDDYIDYKLKKIVKIEIDELNHYIGDTIYENNILKLPDYFFTTKIENSRDVLNLISEYPTLESLLTTYGIFIVGYDKKDNKNDKIIKNLIATYFAAKSSCNEITKIKTAEMTFSTYATSSGLQENIIRELSLIFGEDLLIKTLKEGTEFLEKEIDIQTKKKGLGKKVVTNLVQLSDLSMLEKQYFSECHELEEIINNKLFSMYEKINKYDPIYQDSILNLIKMKDFDFSIISLIDNSINPSDIELLTETEKNLISDFIHQFDENWKNYYYLETNYPKVKYSIDDDGDRVYDGETFTFLNKFLSSTNAYFEEYLRICDTIKNVWRSLQETIILEMLPRYIKNNQESNIDLKEILTLSKYTSDTKKYDLSIKSKTKSLEKKLIKINK